MSFTAVTALKHVLQYSITIELLNYYYYWNQCLLVASFNMGIFRLQGEFLGPAPGTCNGHIALKVKGVMQESRTTQPGGKH